ncbi:hypothetical protein [Ornithinimicrobium avium]|uniref:DUF2975 domain-containing protein n=1 Tax=Ornithinimicrobium avium TaxID=2283195 RepID=A0A345NQD8_9MICO|nr:hypothetical protein [Ornithinimicrobium avium]AXH97246.1 hypothetical protein DV701_14990 [Ornithinimicrobium avium]
MSKRLIETKQPVTAAGRGLALTGGRALNVLQSMAFVWLVVLGVVTLWAPTGISAATLPGVDLLRTDPAVAEMAALSDLPLAARVISWAGTAALFLALTLALGAASQVARQVATAEPFAVGIAHALCRASVALLTAAVVVPLARFVSVAQVERWVQAAPVREWGELALHTSGVALGTPVALLVLALVTGVLVAAFREGERLRQEADGLV